LGVHGVQSTRNSVTTEFRRHRILSVRKSIDPWTRNSIDTEFRRHGIPPLSRNSLVDTEFPCGHRIPPWTRNSVDTEFGQHGIPPTWNSIHTEFHQHGIPPTWNSAYFFYFRIFSMLCYAIYFRSIRGIPWNPRNFADLKSQSLQFV
jgi:hypothetical protein